MFDRPSSAPRRVRASCLLMPALALSAALFSNPVRAVTVEVVWLDEKCDYILAKNDDGHAILFRAMPFDLKPGDRLEGPLDQVGYFRKIAKVGSDETAMMRAEKYGVRRQLAVNLIYDWSRNCDPPEK